MRHFGSCRCSCGRIRVLVRGKAVALLELAREVAGVLVTEAAGCFLDGAAVAQEFEGPLHPQPLEPAARGAAEGRQEKPFQGADGSAAGFRHSRH